MTENLKLFDSNCMIGVGPEFIGSSFDTKNSLQNSMNYYCVEKSITYHALAKYHNPLEGNSLLLDMLGADTKILPQWVVLPNHTGEFISAKILVKELSVNAIASVRLCPKNYGFELRQWLLDELLSEMEQIRIPVFLDLDLLHWSDSVPWDEIRTLCLAYPNLPFVLCRIGCGSNRNLFPLLEQCNNLFFEISYFDANEGIEACTKRFGAERMLFGSASPTYDPACPISMLFYAEITQQQKQLIAGENIQRLIEGIEYV